MFRTLVSGVSLPTSPARCLRLSLPYLTAQAARPREPWTLKHIEGSVRLFALFHFLFSTTGGAENGLPSPYFVPVHDDHDDYSPIHLGPSPSPLSLVFTSLSLPSSLSSQVLSSGILSTLFPFLLSPIRLPYDRAVGKGEEDGKGE